MASKSKEARLEQLKTFEKKLVLRLQQLEQKGISKEKALMDSLVKELKSKIRQTNTRIVAFDKFVQRTQELAQAKAQKLAELAKRVEEVVSEAAAEGKKEEAKPKKKAAADKDETAPKKAKKQADAGGDAEPKKKAPKKKEE